VLPDGRTPLLIIKTINGERFPLDVERLRFAIGTRRDIVVFEQYLSSYLTAALLSRADCYISLHRAEGWGLTLAEAMAVEVPVIATDYSGSQDLVDETCGWPVPYELVTIPDNVAQYAGAGRWANPNVAYAAQCIADIANDPELARLRGLAGHDRVAKLAHSFAGAQVVNDRVQALTTNPVASATIDNNVTNNPNVINHHNDARDPEDDMTTPAFEHRGLGPVILPSAEVDTPMPTGVRGTVRTQVERAIRFEIDRRDVKDHQRAVALVDELSATRQAVRDFIVVQRADQETLTNAITATGDHIAAVQKNHEALHSAVVEIGQHTHSQGLALADVRSELAELRTHIEFLSRSIEQLVSLQRSPQTKPLRSSTTDEQPWSKEVADTQSDSQGEAEKRLVGSYAETRIEVQRNVVVPSESINPGLPSAPGERNLEIPESSETH
jgi:Glycosyl transferases group 1